MSKLERAILSLEGLAMGDAYGNHHGNNPHKHGAATWEYSDDTFMASSIVENLQLYGEINQDALAESFATRWDSQRGYGQGSTKLLKRIRNGTPWRLASTGMFDGKGSYGNGAAMRSAPIGAYFANDLDQVVMETQKSAIITHSHPEGIAGAIIVALATALAESDVESWLVAIRRYVPETETREKTLQVLALDSSTREVAQNFGNGRPSIAQMTVPFSIWCASRYIKDYEKAIRQANGIGGDADTNCAIIGGIVIMSTGIEGISDTWMKRRELLPQWVYE